MACRLFERARFSEFSVESYEEKKRGITKKVTSRLTRGNVRSQLKGFQTRQEHEARLDRLSERLANRPVI